MALCSSIIASPPIWLVFGSASEMHVVSHLSVKLSLCSSASKQAEPSITEPFLVCEGWRGEVGRWGGERPVAVGRGVARWGRARWGEAEWGEAKAEWVGRCGARCGEVKVG